jgi:hypothetical protein
MIKGTMIQIKKILGIILLIAGAGLVFMPNQTAEILCNYKLIFGILTAIAGYLLLKSGSQL